MLRGDGPIPAPIMIVGEAPGEDEEAAGVPFVGASGQELNRMLQNAGLSRSQCFVTNVCRRRPQNNFLGHFIALAKNKITPAHVPFRDKMVMPVVLEGLQTLKMELGAVQPKVIVTVGNLSMWALTGKWTITKWRGSNLATDGETVPGIPVIPTYHPAAILRQWEWRQPAVNDLCRARKALEEGMPPKPNWEFLVRPSFDAVTQVLTDLLARLENGEELWLDFDLETRAGHIACAGISWSATNALCIPFMCVEDKTGYWSADQEAAIIWLLWRLLTHPNVRVRWQNGLYDAQYTWRHWHFVPRGAQDTMISQHTLWNTLPKSLAFQASMYADYYVYWKDEGKEWAKNQREEELWAYNGLDCVYTREVGEVEQRLVSQLGMQQVEDFQQRLFWPVLRAMQIGLRVNDKARGELAMEIQDEVAKREQFFIDLLGHPLNPSSNPQMLKLFYEDLNQPPILKMQIVEGRRVYRPTCDDDALSKIAAREPILLPLCTAIQDWRTLRVLLSTFINARLDTDGRIRCSFNIAGNPEGKSAPATYRLSSSKNAFGSGANLQNIPSEKSKSAGKAAKRGGTFTMPNIRALYSPDQGHTFFDMDLDRADLQVVVWESGEPDFKAAMHMGVDVHLWNAYILDNKEPPPLDELVETHPNYIDYRGKMKYAREFAKVFVHGTNYGGGAATMAKHVGLTTHHADRAQKTWFGAHPGIKKWHERTEKMLFKDKIISNAFGYRWRVFDRLAGLLPEALAWIPQSTVSCVINRAWVNIYDNLPEVQVLLQVHDSLAGQFPTHLKDWAVRRLKEESRIIVPYDDPLIIPVGVKTSEVSWGDCA